MTDILSVIGARPQFVKAAVVSRALTRAGLKEDILHTGQHYDDAMSGAFLRELGIDGIVKNLDAGSGNHAEQTSRMMVGIAKHIETMPVPPKVLLLFGDTNSTIAGAIVASKIGVPIAHVEAGLRSYNRAMPEEVNRVVTDHLSARLYCTSQTAIDNLASEGLTTGVVEVGDVMLDAIETFGAIARDRVSLDSISAGLEPGFVLATIHRPSNTDDETRLQTLVNELGTVGRPVVWPVHPRNAKRLNSLSVPANLILLAPASYFEMLVLLGSCSAVVTDSGGLQKEAHWSKKPCITLRDETEWVETLEGDWNQLADLSQETLKAKLKNAPTTAWHKLYGDGQASDRIAADLAALI